MANSKMRVLLLIKIFTEKTDFDHRLSVPALIHELEKFNIFAERKAIYRDISAIKASGFDIISSSRGYYLNNRTLSFSDIKTLISCVENACFLTDSAQKDLKSKLLKLSNKNERIFLKKRSIINAEKASSDDIFSILDTVCTACSENKQLSFSDGTLKNRYTVNPLTIINNDNTLLLVYTTDDSDEFKLFDLYLMHDASILTHSASSSASMPVLKNKNDLKSFLCTIGETPQNITLRCDSSVKKAFSDKFGSNAFFSREFSNFCTITVYASPTRELISFLAQFGNAVEVISPDSIKNELCTHFENALKKYKK